MLRRLLTVGAALLVGFHVWLFVGQAWDGRLTDIALLSRWAGAGVLAWALLRLRRQSAPMFWGRKAVSIWLLAALLHGPAVAERFGAADVFALPEVVATLAQVVAGATLVLGLFLIPAAWLTSRRRTAPGRALAAARRASAGAIPLGSSFLVAPRPPPVA